MQRLLYSLVLSVLTLGFASSAMAIPSLQLGPGDGNWSYDDTTQTWVTTDNPLNLAAFANSEDGKGAYAWDSAGADDQIAFLVVSSGTTFDVTVMNDGVNKGPRTRDKRCRPISVL